MQNESGVLDDRAAFQQEQLAQERLATTQLQLAGEPTVRTTDEISAQMLDGSDPGWSLDANVNASAVDVILENTGGRPALITSVEATIHDVIRLERCLAGGGAVYVAALYSIIVPVGDDGLSHAGQFRADLPFEVEGNSVDRLAITVGPDQSGFDDLSYVYDTDLRLVLADGSALELGRFGLISPIETDLVLEALYSGKQHDSDCMRKNVADVEEVITRPGRKAPALAEFASAMRSVGFAP